MGTYLAGGKDFDPVLKNLEAITGQKPKLKYAKLSVSNFKLREGNPNGAFVTLRRDKAYIFLEKLVAIILPRVRDFRGLSRKSFDTNGNYSIVAKTPDFIIML